MAAPLIGCCRSLYAVPTVCSSHMHHKTVEQVPPLDIDNGGPRHFRGQESSRTHMHCKSGTHVATRQCLLLQELQLQLDSSHHSKEAAVAELQTQLANHKAVREELSKAQAERDSARQAAAKFEDLYVNATTVSVHSYISSIV